MNCQSESNGITRLNSYRGPNPSVQRSTPCPQSSRTNSMNSSRKTCRVATSTRRSLQWPPRSSSSKRRMGNYSSSRICHEPCFSLPLTRLQRPILAFESILLFRFDFNSTSIRFQTFETIRTSLITQLPVTVHPVGSPWSLDREESKTTTHICTSMAQDIILQSIGALIDPMT